MFKTLQPLILASESPRRKRLLQSVGIELRVEPSGIDEVGAPSGTPAEIARRWAYLKAHSVSGRFPRFWVLGADTVVVLDGQIFGKPASPMEAGSMLQQLSGRTHEVITGMCLVYAAANVLKTGSVTTRVQFKDLTTEEIDAYARTSEPMDKAGAYGIQGIGSFLARSIEGSYTNVVGLPLCETIEWLAGEKVIEPV